MGESGYSYSGYLRRPPAVLLCVFFSSRRRHTRFDCDWSSDVCSSDLPREEPVAQAIADRALAQAALLEPRDDFLLGVRHVEPVEECAVHVRAVAEVSVTQIGRASCRERV